jgi:hypothetical protein
MIKCKRFWTTTEYDDRHGNYDVNAVVHYNDWISDDVEIFSVQALADAHGSCKEIVVFYSKKPEPFNESGY